VNLDWPTVLFLSRLFFPFMLHLNSDMVLVCQQDGWLELAWKQVGRGRNGGVAPPLVAY
jgi:hypothetical protein